MNKSQIEDEILHMLRVALVALRNLLEGTRFKKHEDKKILANFCHSLPAVLLSKCNTEAVKYFLEVHSVYFVNNYKSNKDQVYTEVRDSLIKLFLACDIDMAKLINKK